MAKDKVLPPLGLLNTKAMTDLSALAGTTGTSACLIHGDVWDQFEALDTRSVLKNQQLTVFGGSTELIKTNMKQTVIGTTNTNTSVFTIS